MSKPKVDKFSYEFRPFLSIISGLFSHMSLELSMGGSSLQSGSRDVTFPTRWVCQIIPLHTKSSPESTRLVPLNGLIDLVIYPTSLKHNLAEDIRSERYVRRGSAIQIDCSTCSSIASHTHQASSSRCLPHVLHWANINMPTLEVIITQREQDRNSKYEAAPIHPRCCRFRAHGKE